MFQPIVRECLAVPERRYLRPFSLSAVTYMLPAGFRRAFGADSKKPLILVQNQRLKVWMRGQDLNLRPSGYEPDELPGCSTPRQRGFWPLKRQRRPFWAGVSVFGIVRCFFLLRADLAATYSPAS